MNQQELNGLIGEVETEDMYHMRHKDDIVSINDPTYIHVKGHERPFNFEPDIIFDLGANIGVFTKYCLGLFPNAKIIAVEPDEANCEWFRREINNSNVTLIQAAIGNGGDVYKVIGMSVNGTGECYLSVGLGYTEGQMDEMIGLGKMRKLGKSITLSELYKQHVKDGQKFIVKMDIEGSENFVLCHLESLEILKKADYFTCELHYYAMTGQQQQEVNSTTERILKEFEATHICSRQEIYFYATKKC